MFFSTRNLATLSATSNVDPWDFKPTMELTAEIRNDKTARQRFYQNPNTSHQFYTGIEGANPNMRPSKDNTPTAIHAFAVDYDCKIDDLRVEEAIKAFKIKPAYSEKSLGVGRRLVWILPQPFRTGSADFTTFVLEAAIKWLDLNALPGLDAPAFTTFTRLLANGCDWKATGHGAVPEIEAQSFFVKTAQAFNFKGGAGVDIPLEVAEKRIKELYPAFSWPSDFTLDSQGPTFWIPESVSPMSAILKAEGLITFAAHATQPFYPWSEILGKEFCAEFAKSAIAKATTDIWFDGRKYYRRGVGKQADRYLAREPAEMMRYLTTTCGLSTKAVGGPSQVDLALEHLNNNCRIEGAMPFVFRRTGMVEHEGRQVLNTYCRLPVQPAPGVAGKWGEDFPFMAAWLDAFFEPANQLDHFLAWWQYAYQCAINFDPHPGLTLFFVGETGIGKTLLTRECVGTSLGGCTDASGFLVKGESFNNDLFESAVWCIDDDSPAGSEQGRQMFAAAVKKTTANASFRYNKKFESAGMVPWTGRVLVTLNCDSVSRRMLVGGENGAKDKISLLRCQTDKTKFIFPGRTETLTTIARELPYFLRWLLAWTPPAHIIREPRYGFKSFHEQSLMDQAVQGSSIQPFKEMLIESLTEYFRDNPKEACWEGSTNQITRMLQSNPLNDHIMRGMRSDQMNRATEIIERSGTFGCTSYTGKHQIRIWKFNRDDT